MSQLTSESVSALFELARQSEESERPAESIKCMLAVLSTDPLPELRLRAAFELSRLYMAFTSNMQQAKEVLHKLMMFIKSQPERTQDRCECHSRLADIDLRLEAPDAALEACQEGMEAVKAGPMRSSHAQRWWLHFGCKAAAAGAAGGQAWQGQVQMALEHLQGPLRRIALLVSELHAHVLLDSPAPVLAAKLHALQATHASLEAAEAAHDYAAELLLHQHFLHAHMRMSQKPIDDTHTFLETYGDSIGQVLHKMNALLTDLEGATGNGAQGALLPMQGRLETWWLQCAADRVAALSLQMMRATALFLTGKALRHQWLELGTQTGLAMAMLAATQMHRFGCGSACQLGNGALVAENDPSASGRRGVVALHHIARGIRAVQADLKLPPDVSEWGGACAVNQGNPAQLVRTTLYALCAMYQLTGVNGSDDTITWATCQQSLLDLQASVLPGSSGRECLRPLVHSLTGSYAHLTNDWEAAHRHYSAALQGCSGGADRSPVMPTLVAAQLALLHLDSKAKDGPATAAAIMQANAETLALHAATDEGAADKPNAWVALLTSLVSSATHSAKISGGSDTADNVSAAHAHLCKALQLAHNQVLHDQLTLLVLVTFAPVQLLKGDEAGAADMVRSALVQAKLSRDGNTRLLAMAACDGVGFWNEEKIHYASKKAQEWSRKARAAVTAAPHSQLLLWH